jgi:hypothetical protein
VPSGTAAGAVLAGALDAPLEGAGAAVAGWSAGFGARADGRIAPVCPACAAGAGAVRRRTVAGREVRAVRVVRTTATGAAGAVA